MTEGTEPSCQATGAVSPGAPQTELAAMLKALGDPSRLQMAQMIAARPGLCVCEITPAFALSPATVSHHLKTLRDAGLVEGERRGTFVYYSTTPAGQRLVAALRGAAPQP